MRLDQVLKKLKGYIYSEFGTASEYAKSKGFSKAYISAVLTGKREPNDSILKDIGVAKVKTTTYSKAANNG
tara:strand:+ start:290 stop:502 length:213 start_codon:yes stop_codon:yes gene_type:complete